MTRGEPPKPLHDQVPAHAPEHLSQTSAKCRAPGGQPCSRVRHRCPLDSAGHLDAEGWHKARDRCRVRRIWNGEPVRHGRLVHRAGGANGATWIVDYDDRTTADDEAGYRLDAHRFVEGEYVSIRDDAGELHTFVVNHVGKT